MRTTHSPAASACDLFPTRLRRHVQEQPDRSTLAFLDEDLSIQQSWTYADLDRRARSIAAYLQQSGRSGKPVVVAYPSCLEFVAAFCGCLYSGAVAVPACLPRAHGVDERLSTIVADSDARLVLTGHRYRPIIDRHLQSIGAVEVVAGDDLAEQSAAWIPPEWSAGQLAFLQYTSGSTRTPSGVMISHGALAANLNALHEMLGTSAGSIGVNWLPLFHDMGLVAGALEPIWVGYPAYLMAPATFIQSPLRWLRAFGKYRGTIGGGPNFGYQACVDAAKSVDTAGLDLSSWELAWNGAEPVRASTVREFRDTFAAAGFRPQSTTPSFGLAEATLLVTSNSGTVTPLELAVDEYELRSGRVLITGEASPAAKILVSSGRPAPGTDIRIVDSEGRTECAAEQVGEIWVRSASLGDGYWNKPDESRSTFGAHLTGGADGPFLRTGDLGFVHAGELFVTGRIKDVIVIRGVNYYPHDIEQTIGASHPALRHDAAAVFATEEGSSIRLVAVQELRRESRRTVNAGEVFVAMRRAVAREHQLALNGIVLLKTFGLPKTSSGKVQRSGCRTALQERSLPVLAEWWAPTAQVAPIDFTGEPLTQPGVLERQLIDWLKRECALTELTWKTPLMELGIDSLKGVELANVLSAAFNHAFSATLLIDHPTVESLAALIRRDVLGVKPEAPAHLVLSLASAAPAVSAEDLSALNLDELDMMLEGSIDAVLKSGGRA